MIYTKEFSTDAEKEAWQSVHADWVPAVYMVGDEVVFIPGNTGPELVDLGLSVKWCKYNVGATKEEEYGKLFAWGDTVGSEATSEGCSGKYSSSWYAAQGLTAITSDLTLEQDAANVAYGGNYRMPTSAEMEELTANTTYSNETINGVAGGKFTASNGNYIFVPFAGYCEDGDMDYIGLYSYCWSSSFGNSYDGWYLLCYSGGSRSVDDRNRRYCGYSVRGVA